MTYFQLIKIGIGRMNDNLQTELLWWLWKVIYVNPLHLPVSCALLS